MWRLMLMTATLGLTPPPPGALGFIDSATLIAACKAEGPEAPAKTAICLGYVAGVTDELMRQQAAADEEDRTICPAPGLTISRVAQAVADHSGWDVTAKPVGGAAFVKRALEDEFPCLQGADRQ